MILPKALRPVQVLLVISAVRVLSVFVVTTSFVPDEYWQSMEVAHKLVFGYGALTWEWQRGLRSYLYPGLISVLYAFLKFTGLDYPEAVILVPRVFQALISAYADYRFYKWTGSRKWALFLILTSWFWFYNATRTLLQTLETCLITIGLSMFPFKAGRLAYYEKENNSWVWFACVSTFIRPTSFPIWLTLASYNMYTTNQGFWNLIFKTYMPIGLITVGSLVGLDTYFHGSFILTPWEFFKFNALHDLASFYGTHTWYWYIVVAVPAVLLLNMLPLLMLIIKVFSRPKENQVNVLLIAVMFIHLAFHSGIEHKELRFILPLTPIMLYLIQDVIVQWSRKAGTWQLYLAAGLLFISNALPVAYFGSIHQGGTMQVMPLIRESITSNRSSVLFMMPCHSTPMYSHLHINVTTRYLNCDPPMSTNSVTEQETFYNNPEAWWKKEYATRQPPTLVVLFDKLLGRVEHLLKDYKLLHEVYHTRFPEGEVGENVLLYKRQPRVQADRAI